MNATIKRFQNGKFYWVEEAVYINVFSILELKKQCSNLTIIDNKSKSDITEWVVSFAELHLKFFKKNTKY